MGPYEIKPSSIAGCVEIIPRILEDERGRFVKLFQKDYFIEHQLNAVYQEQYYSVSSQRVLRGLHFQIPPHAHIKLVSCITGSILDVVVDLRKNSSTYKNVFSLELSSRKGNMLYVPEGLAHGFYVLSSTCIFLSLNSKKYSPESDSAIHWNSIGFNWPDSNPVVSEKDNSAISLNTFLSPF